MHSHNSNGVLSPAAGFTLIEISVVLVIIGLIVGGILVGRDLIRGAEIRAQVTQIEKYNTALNAFKIKYNCMPGDCLASADFGLGAVANLANGNGVIDCDDGGVFPSAPMCGELSNFWVQLSAANLVDGHYTDALTVPTYPVPGVHSPPLKMKGMGLNGNPGGGVWLSSFNPFPGGMTKMDNWLLTTFTHMTGPNQTAGVYLPYETYMVDLKIDDGLPLAGIMQPVHWGFSVLFPALMKSSGHPDACIDDTVAPAIYNLAGGTLPTQYSLCAPMIRFSWYAP